MPTSHCISAVLLVRTPSLWFVEVWVHAVHAKAFHPNKAEIFRETLGTVTSVRKEHTIP